MKPFFLLCKDVAGPSRLLAGLPWCVGMQLEEAEKKMSEAGLQLVVQDTNYVRTMPPDCGCRRLPV